ncbi:hypothetical protein Ga0100231_010565 [Opitutaceae bacterium TAV4]|nr:hypothetical protein Ga0100231_010565 [Opitutaceae bacterium TAV4]
MPAPSATHRRLARNPWNHPPPPPLKVTCIGSRITPPHALRDIPCLNFQRQRRTGLGARASYQGHALRLEFDKPITLPYGFGYAAHFGLGLFAPVL